MACSKSRSFNPLEHTIPWTAGRGGGRFFCVRFAAALSDTIAEFQQHYPGSRFRCSAPQTHHRAMRVSWILLRPDGTQLTQGMDFYDLAPDGHISRVVGFFGAPPTP